MIKSIEEVYSIGDKAVVMTMHVENAIKMDKR